jgi:hypothetical protein
MSSLRSRKSLRPRAMNRVQRESPDDDARCMPLIPVMPEMTAAMSPATCTERTTGIDLDYRLYSLHEQNELEMTNAPS